MKESKINQTNNFISGWYMPVSICNKLLKYHKTSTQKFAGNVGHISINESVVDSKIKDSIDVILNEIELKKIYFNCLQKCLDEYRKLYTWCDFKSLGVIENTTIQMYQPPNGGFHAWHYERTSIRAPIGFRHLVFMTYLNTVTEGGETEFLYQNVKIKPERGLTLIWPSEWTHVHRGLKSTQTKYIITGWISHIVN